MRVTQSMMNNSSLRSLSQSYKTLLDLQNQMSTGKKISRASQDPVIAMNGMRYRTQVTEVQQFDRNLSETYNWMDNADATLDKATKTLQRIRELAVQVSNDTYEGSQRENVEKEVAQLYDHLISLANTKSNNKYIFNGTDTTNAPVNGDALYEDLDGLGEALGSFDPAAGTFDYDIVYGGDKYVLDSETSTSTNYVFVSVDDDTDTITFTTDDDKITTILHEYNDEDGDQKDNTLKDKNFIIVNNQAVSTNTQDVEFELLKGVNVGVNIRPSNVFSTELFGTLKLFSETLSDSDSKHEDISKFIDQIDKQINNMVDERAELGARYNRVEMIEERVLEQEVIARRIMSDNEDADIAEVITELLSAENVHRASLSSMARIMQPTLMDLLR